jgi:hypothetical protein
MLRGAEGSLCMSREGTLEGGFVASTLAMSRSIIFAVFKQVVVSLV